MWKFFKNLKKVFEKPLYEGEDIRTREKRQGRLGDFIPGINGGVVLKDDVNSYVVHPSSVREIEE